VLLFAALAPVSLVALPLAALLVAARPGTRAEWVTVALAGGAGVALLAAPEQGVFDALARSGIEMCRVAVVGSGTPERLVEVADVEVDGPLGLLELLRTM